MKNIYMSLNEFIILNEEQQAETAWTGIFLDLRTDGIHSILLFDLGSFYAELYYEHTRSEIEKVMSFNSTDALGPYLDLIKIDEIENLL